MKEKTIQWHHLYNPNENFWATPTPTEIMFLEESDALLAALSIAKNWWLKPYPMSKTYYLSQEPSQEQLYQTFLLRTYNLQTQWYMWIPNRIVAEENPEVMHSEDEQYKLISQTAVRLYLSLGDYVNDHPWISIVDKTSIEREIQKLKVKKSLTWSEEKMLKEFEILLDHSYFKDQLA